MSVMKKIVCASITICLCLLLFNSQNFISAEELSNQGEAFSVQMRAEKLITFDGNKGNLYFPPESVKEDFTLTVNKVLL